MQHRRKAEANLSGSDPARETIHDLRNLFAVTGSIGHLLRICDDQGEREKMLRGLESAAARGGELTSQLLSRDKKREPHLLDVGAQVAEAAPMLRAVLRPPASLEIDTQVAMPAALVRADPAELEAVMLELVANAGAAGAQRVLLRCRRIGTWIWLVVADDGPGLLVEDHKEQAQRADRPGHGIGLNRVRKAIQDMEGKLLIRGRAGTDVGTVVAMLLPMALRAVSKSRAREWSASPLNKETSDEDRRTIAA